VYERSIEHPVPSPLAINSVRMIRLDFFQIDCGVLSFILFSSFLLIPSRPEGFFFNIIFENCLRRFRGQLPFSLALLAALPVPVPERLLVFMNSYPVPAILRLYW